MMTNGLTSTHHKIDEQFESFRARIHDAVDRADSAAKSTSSWLQTAWSSSTNAIKSHPFAALGIAFGVGYAITRFVRK